LSQNVTIPNEAANSANVTATKIKSGIESSPAGLLAGRFASHFCSED
jgi:hypothetical protein